MAEATVLVDPASLRAPAGRLRGVGTDVAELSSTAGGALGTAAGAAGDVAVEAACIDAGTALRVALHAVATDADLLGRAVSAAGAAYQATDDAAIRVSTLSSPTPAEYGGGTVRAAAA